MLTKLLLASALLYGALLAGLISPAEANLVTNGTFSNPSLAVGTWSEFASIPGWTVNQDNIEIDSSNVVMSTLTKARHKAWKSTPTCSTRCLKPSPASRSGPGIC